MKKVMVFIATLLAAFNVFACFNSDPSSMLQNTAQTVSIGGGGQVDIFALKWSEPYDDAAVVIDAAFPLTLNISFTGFVADDGTADTDIVQLVIFYFDKTAGWQVLKKINDPRYTVVSDSARALFGRHTITGPLGYEKGEYIPVVFYFKSSSGAEAFDLEAFLANRSRRDAPSSVEGAVVLGLKVSGNRIAH